MKFLGHTNLIPKENHMGSHANKDDISKPSVEHQRSLIGYAQLQKQNKKMEIVSYNSECGGVKESKRYICIFLSLAYQKMQDRVTGGGHHKQHSVAHGQVAKVGLPAQAVDIVHQLEDQEICQDHQPPEIGISHADVEIGNALSEKTGQRCTQRIVGTRGSRHGKLCFNRLRHLHVNCFAPLP